MSILRVFSALFCIFALASAVPVPVPSVNNTNTSPRSLLGRRYAYVYTPNYPPPPTPESSLVSSLVARRIVNPPLGRVARFERRVTMNKNNLLSHQQLAPSPPSPPAASSASESSSPTIIPLPSSSTVAAPTPAPASRIEKGKGKELKKHHKKTKTIQHVTQE
ncbi:hypothetical protein C8F01DRAFT_1251214 [Mycena amicta]|nr:hypothetical protein C8F01DRAFT_1251214 [Mycena amicta]